MLLANCATILNKICSYISSGGGSNLSIFTGTVLVGVRSIPVSGYIESFFITTFITN